MAALVCVVLFNHNYSPTSSFNYGLDNKNMIKLKIKINTHNNSRPMPIQNDNYNNKHLSVVKKYVFINLTFQKLYSNITL